MYIDLADATTIRIWYDLDDGRPVFYVDATNDDGDFSEEIYDWDYAARDRILTLDRAYELASAFRDEYGLGENFPVYYAGSVAEGLEW